MSEAEAAARDSALRSKGYVRRIAERDARREAARVLEEAASAAQTDELTTAAEVIYDLRARAAELRRS